MGIMNRHRQDRVPRTSTLIAFETVARYGNVSRAARELGMLQSSVSRQISGLERQFQVRLFDRTASGVRLTEAGQRVYDATVAALGLLGTAFEEATRHSSGEGVVITCCCWARAGVGLALLDRGLPGGRDPGSTRRRVSEAPQPLLCIAHTPRAEEPPGAEVSGDFRAVAGVTSLLSHPGHASENLRWAVAVRR